MVVLMVFRYVRGKNGKNRERRIKKVKNEEKLKESCVRRNVKCKKSRKWEKNKWAI